MFSCRVTVAIPKIGTALGAMGFSRAPLRGFADGGCEHARDQFRAAPPFFWAMRSACLTKPRSKVI